MEIETSLAKASLTRVEQRDPYKLFHKVDLKGLQAMTPSFDWDAYLKAAGLPALDTFNVTEPAFFTELDKQLQARSLDDIKTYLRWHLVHAEAPYPLGGIRERELRVLQQDAARRASSCSRAGSAA